MSSSQWNGSNGYRLAAFSHISYQDHALMVNRHVMTCIIFFNFRKLFSELHVFTEGVFVEAWDRVGKLVVFLAGEQSKAHM